MMPHPLWLVTPGGSRGAVLGSDVPGWWIAYAPSMAPTLHLAQSPEADALLSNSPLALLIGMVLDQQIPLEWAFTGPLTLANRLGRDLDAADIAARDPRRSRRSSPPRRRCTGSRAPWRA